MGDRVVLLFSRREERHFIREIFEIWFRGYVPSKASDSSEASIVSSIYYSSYKIKAGSLSVPLPINKFIVYWIPMPDSFTPTPQEIRKASQHLRYEWDMLLFSFDLLHVCSTHNTGLLINLALEDFLLHARVLKDFFYQNKCQRTTKNNRTDVYATDYISNWGETQEQKIPDIISCVEWRLDKSLAHLTYTRITLSKITVQEASSIYKELVKVWNEFVSKITNDKKQWFL